MRSKPSISSIRASPLTRGSARARSNTLVCRRSLRPPLRRAYAVHPISAVQMEYSPFSLEIEDPQTDVLHTCRELGVAVVAYSPLGRGMLTGRYKSPDDLDPDDWRRTVPRFWPENFSKT